MAKTHVDNIEARIAELPSGGITYKTISGKRYAYYQWSEDGKQHSRRVKDEEFSSLSAQIEERKALQQKLKESKVKPAVTVKKGSSKSASTDVKTDSSFSSVVITGESLREFVLPVANAGKRKCFSEISDYINGKTDSKLLLLSGLRSSGKTTLMRQIISCMDDVHFSKTAFMRVTSVSLKKQLQDIEALVLKGFKYLFIDEFRCLKGASAFLVKLADLYTTRGVKIVVAGVSSLSLLSDDDGSLYEKSIVVRTTFIPFSDYVSLFSNYDVEDYIVHGGVLTSLDSRSKENHFSDENSVSDYLENFLYKSIFDSLSVSNASSNSKDLSFTLSSVRDSLSFLCTNWVLYVLNKQPDFSDLYSCLVSYVDSLAINKDMCKNMTGMLQQIDFIVSVPFIDTTASSSFSSRYIFVQPGLCYSLAENLLQSFLNSSMFDSLTREEKTFIFNRLLVCVKEQLLVDSSTLHKLYSSPGLQISEVKFDFGSYDMIIWDNCSPDCEAIQVSLTNSDGKAQLLRDTACLSVLEHKFGRVSDKVFVYTGLEKFSDGIRYTNVADYLQC